MKFIVMPSIIIILSIVIFLIHFNCSRKTNFKTLSLIKSKEDTLSNKLIYNVIKWLKLGMDETNITKRAIYINYSASYMYMLDSIKNSSENSFGASFGNQSFEEIPRNKIYTERNIISNKIDRYLPVSLITQLIR